MSAVRKGLLMFAGMLLLPALARAQAQERWLADLKVQMTATEDPVAGTIKHVIRVTNQGDDTARDVGITHIPVVGMAILGYSSTSGTCQPRSYNHASVWVIHCPVTAMDVGATEKVVVVTRNTTTWTGLKVHDRPGHGHLSTTAAPTTWRRSCSPSLEGRRARRSACPLGHLTRGHRYVTVAGCLLPS